MKCPKTFTTNIILKLTKYWIIHLSATLTKIRAYSTTINITTCILINIAFRVCGFEDVFTQLYSHMGVQIVESFSLQIQIMGSIIQYERVYNKNTHAKMLRAQIIQNKIRLKNLKQVKDEIKGSLMETVFLFTLYFKDNIKQSKQI